MSKSVKRDASKRKLSQSSENSPSTYWTAVTNIGGNGQTIIVVPQAGNLWVFYEYVQPALQIYVWHQGGATTQINPGENNIKVNEGDELVYMLNNPEIDEIKLGYQIT